MLTKLFPSTWLLAALLFHAGGVFAGNWGENWGSLHWEGIPLTVPESPVITRIDTEPEALIVFFTPGGDGGSTITEYTVTCGSISEAGSNSPVTLSGLPSDTQYNCSVSATNAIGTSSSSMVVKTSTSSYAAGLNIILIKAAIDAQNKP